MKMLKRFTNSSLKAWVIFYEMGCPAVAKSKADRSVRCIDADHR